MGAYPYHVMTWKLECNIDIGGHTKKSDKTNKKSNRFQLLEEIGKIRFEYFPWKDDEELFNWNFQNS